jgi:hypothetical protein
VARVKCVDVGGIALTAAAGVGMQVVPLAGMPTQPPRTGQSRLAHSPLHSRPQTVPATSSCCRARRGNGAESARADGQQRARTHRAVRACTCVRQIHHSEGASWGIGIAAFHRCALVLVARPPLPLDCARPRAHPLRDHLGCGSGHTQRVRGSSHMRPLCLLCLCAVSSFSARDRGGCPIKRSSRVRRPKGAAHKHNTHTRHRDSTQGTRHTQAGGGRDGEANAPLTGAVRALCGAQAGGGPSLRAEEQPSHVASATSGRGRTCICFRVLNRKRLPVACPLTPCYLFACAFGPIWA